jgi:hypothetical protein
MSADFHAEIEKLRAWLATNRWVDDYADWWSAGGVVSAVERFLADSQPEDWSEDEVTDLLYVLEQSSTDYIAELIARSETAALTIAKHALTRGSTAGGDIAEQLGYCIQYRDEAEALLITFTRDTYEGTRRMALLSLAELRSTAVPALAVAAWDTGEEYPRMGALCALRKIGSVLFPVYLARALEDGRPNLISLARRYAGKPEKS